MRPVHVSGMVILSLCWITCVMVSAGATAAPDQFQVQARDAGQGVVSGQATQPTLVGQPNVQLQTVQSINENSAQNNRATNGQEQGATGNAVPARAQRMDMTNTTSFPVPQDENTAGQERPVQSDRGNMTSSRPGPLAGNFTDQIPPVRTGYDNITAPNPSLNGGNMTMMHESGPFAANETARPPLTEPDVNASQAPSAEVGSKDPAGSSFASQNAGQANAASAATNSQELSRNQIESIIQSFLTWLGAQSVR